ncbi:MAG: glycine cleavage system protein H [Verrucomicrobiales bacterium]|nr:glycine cleavage system protein H [Verrucomicrobiales bacterium]
MSSTLFYKRATFVAHLPQHHRYTPSHAWLAPSADSSDVWQVGLTKFALRMLGELVEIRFETAPEQWVSTGEIVGNIEGFKAVSDLYCVVEGRFLGGNPALDQGLEILTRQVHETWMYQVAGKPDPKTMNVMEYAALLDATIDRILEKQGASAPSEEQP